MRLFELKKTRETALNKAESLVAAAQNAGREMTASEQSDYDIAMNAVQAINPQIKRIERDNTLRTHMVNGVLMPGNNNGEGRSFAKPAPRILSPEYADAFFSYIASNGAKMDAALYEGSNPAGGYVVPVVVDDQIVPLAPNEMSVRRLATVIPTVSDIKIPTKTAFGTAGIKTELSSFGESEPTLGQFTLSAYMIGLEGDVSWELAQDVPSFQQFAMQDQIIAVQQLEEHYFVNGSGSGQPQGLIGNVGAGVVEEADTNGNLVTIAGTLDLIGKLNEIYQPGASWLMSRATSIVLRKAQTESNLFAPAWTREGGVDRLWGFPVAYSQEMPSTARGNTPILFGDFKQGYVIGDRGGSGINIKVLDQPKATSGILVLLAYRRVDGRVRRSEAIQPYYVAAS
jgi:HK97 family phage major capsid protein